jgi:nucleoside-triphosphatase
MTPEQAWATGHKRLFVTGEMQSGKTTWCARMVAHVRDSGATVRGVLSPAVFVDGVKVGIDLVNLATDERHHLADRRQANDTGEILTEQWRFAPDVLAWGDTVLRQINAADLLLIDELGPLELTRGAGWQSALALLDAERYRTACVVVRPALLNHALQRWGGHIVRVD